MSTDDIDIPATRLYLAIRYGDGRVIQGEFEAPDLHLRMDVARGKRDVTGDRHFDGWSTVEVKPNSTSLDLHIGGADTVRTERPPAWISNH